MIYECFYICTEEVNQLIVYGTFNSGYSELSCWMLEMKLTDLVSERHGGQRPIHAIDQNLSKRLNIAKVGYVPFGKVRSTNPSIRCMRIFLLQIIIQKLGH